MQQTLPPHPQAVLTAVTVGDPVQWVPYKMAYKMKLTWPLHGGVLSASQSIYGGSGVLFSSFQTTTDLTLFLKKMKSSIINMQYGISFRSCS